jgi:hypothetical protein
MDAAEFEEFPDRRASGYSLWIILPFEAEPHDVFGHQMALMKISSSAMPWRPAFRTNLLGRDWHSLGIHHNDHRFPSYPEGGYIRDTGNYFVAMMWMDPAVAFAAVSGPQQVGREADDKLLEFFCFCLISGPDALRGCGCDVGVSPAFNGWNPGLLDQQPERDSFCL